MYFLTRFSVKASRGQPNNTVDMRRPIDRTVGLSHCYCTVHWASYVPSWLKRNKNKSSGLWCIQHNTGGEGLRLGLSYHYAVLWYRFSHQPAEGQRATVQPTPGAAHPWSHILDHTVSLESTEFKKKHKHSCNHKCTLLRKLLFLFLRDSAEPCVTENRCFGNQYLRCSGYLLRLPCHGWGQIHCSPHRWPRSSCLHFHDSNSRHQWLLRQLLEHLKKDAGRNMSRLYVV